MLQKVAPARPRSGRNAAVAAEPGPVDLDQPTEETLLRRAAVIRQDARERCAEYVSRVNAGQHGE